MDSLIELLDIEGLKTRIVADAVERIVDDMSYDVKQKALKQATVSISSAINDMVAASLNAKYQPITNYGEPDGEETTLRDEFIKACSNWWEQRVDKDGDPANRYSGMPRYKRVAQQVIGDVLSSRLRKDFDRLLAESKEQVKKGLAEVVADAITKSWGN